MSREAQGENSPENHKGKSDQPLFVHSTIDEAGLSPVQFRVLAHLSRRAGGNGLIYSSLADIAKVCCLRDEKTVKKALKALEERGVIRTEPQVGRPSNRTINPVSDWKSNPTQNSTPPKKPPGSQNGRSPHPKNHPPPPPKNHPQRVSIEGNPKKVLQTRFPDALNSDEFKTAWKDWNDHLKATGKSLSPQAVNAQLIRCEEIGTVRAVVALKHSVENNWRTLHEPGDSEKGTKKKSAKPESEFGLEDTIWTGDLSTIIRLWNEGDRDPAYLAKTLAKVQEYAKEERIIAFMRHALPEHDVQAIMAFSGGIPVEGRAS